MDRESRELLDDRLTKQVTYEAGGKQYSGVLLAIKGQFCHVIDSHQRGWVHFSRIFIHEDS